MALVPDRNARRGPPRRRASLARRLGGWALVLVVSAVALCRVALAPNPATPAGTRVALAQLTHLGDGLEARANRMQRDFPEGRVFTLALYGLAWVDVGLGSTDPELRARALREARTALALAEAPASRRAFTEAGGLPYGMFYEAWTAHLRAGTLHLGGGAAGDGAFRAACDRLDAAFRTHGPFADSYPGMAWPGDNAVGAGVLASCGTLLDPRYARAAEDWLRAAFRRADPATGLIPHEAWSPGARGSSAALMIRFVREIDPAVAAAQYDAFERAFATRLAGVLPAVREYPRGARGAGDVDSGPIVLGVSAPASVVGIAAARMVGREAAAADLRASPEVLGLPLQWRGHRSYAFGALPVGEAFLAWASVVRPWNVPPAAPSQVSPFGAWRWIWEGGWGLLLALSLVRLAGLLRLARAGGRPAAAGLPRASGPAA